MNVINMLMTLFFFSLIFLQAQANPCSEIFDTFQQPKLTTNLQLTSRRDLPKKKFSRLSKYPEAGYTGHEFLELNKQAFSNPDKLRQWINNYTQGRGSYSLNIDIQAIKDPQKLVKDYLHPIPKEFHPEIIDLLTLLATDVQGRGYYEPIDRGFQSYALIFTLRSEKYRLGFESGHAHTLRSYMTYSLSPIGRGTEIDKQGRESNVDRNIKEDDYIKITSPTTVSLIGRTWHRTPVLKPGEKRLLVLALFMGF